MHANAAGGFDMLIDGVLRTQVATFNLTAMGSSTRICWVSERLGADVVLGTSDTCLNANVGHGAQRVLIVTNPDSAMAQGDLTIPNPPIIFASAPSSVVFDATASQATLSQMSHPMEIGSFILQNLDAVCTPVVEGRQAWMRHDGVYYLHDARALLVENTLENPAETASAAGPLWTSTCPTAPKTFLNKDTCVRRPECSHAASVDTITLDEATIRSFVTSGTYLFKITGFDVLSTPSPCAHRVGHPTNYMNGVFSRWWRTSGACASDTALDADTLAAIVHELLQTRDCYETVTKSPHNHDHTCYESTNPHVKDISIPRDAPCSDDSHGASITVDGACWTHVHRSEGNVMDLTMSEMYEPRGTGHTGTRTGIETTCASAAAVGNITVDVRAFNPESNRGNYNWLSPGTTTYWEYLFAALGEQKAPMTTHTGSFGNTEGRWQSQLGQVGRYGDTISFADLPSYLQTPTTIALLGATGTQAYDGSEACGSPGEVASDPDLGHVFGLYATVGVGACLTSWNPRPVQN